MELIKLHPKRIFLQFPTEIQPFVSKVTTATKSRWLIKESFTSKARHFNKIALNRHKNSFRQTLNVKADRVFALCYRKTDGIVFETGERVYIASSLEERRKVYQMVYQIYHQVGFTSYSPSGLWVSYYDTLPETSTLVIEEKGEIKGTATLVFDSTDKLPADAIYPDELNQFRQANKSLFEVTSLVVAKNHWNNLTTLFYLMGSLGMLGFYFHEKTDLVITVLARRESFYKKALLFDRIGEVKPYSKVNNVRAILMHLSKEKLDRIIDMVLANDPSIKGTIYSILYFTPELRRELLDYFSLSISPMTEREKAFFSQDKIN